MTLYFEEQGVGEPVALVHGLFGSGVNWRGIARKLGEAFQVFNIDLPNHGRSPHSASMHYDHMSEALYQLTDALPGNAFNWVGHSMGGKAVMNLALTRPDCIERLVIVDIAPVAYRRSHVEYIDAMLALDLDSIRNRADAERGLRDAVEDPATRLFLLQNLVSEDGRFRWRLNLPLLRRQHDDIMGFPDRAGTVFEGPVLVLSGEDSSYVDAAGRGAVAQYFPNARFEAIPAAGHWVHADQPQAVSDALRRFIQDGS